MTHVWVDGRLLSAAGPHVSAFDRGFQMGDAVFETLRARGGRVAELEDHLARLRRSAEAMEIALGPEVDARVGEGIAALLAADELDSDAVDAAIRITVSRGSWSSRSVLPAVGEGETPTVVIQAWPATPPPSGPSANGISVIVSGIRRDPASPLVGVKTTSRAEYVYARLEARRRGADDALFVTVSGHLSEATSANVFLVRTAPDGAMELTTPSLDCGVLAGTTRSWLLTWAANAGLRPVEGLLTPDDLASADEAFLSSSVAGIVPIVRFEDGPIGDGRPGRWTLRARADREAFIAN
ncbi:MAG TPA: aminotransferase class IV [Candidatus Limnocylindrales bacterium]|nr:aminotransferase class IV [Candidatus Limnocylindrales bacterium]